MTALVIRIAAALLALAAWPAQAALATNLDRCRAEIARISENPRTPDEAYCLGLSYQFAILRKRDSEKAVAVLRRAADQNHAAAQVLLGYLIEQGTGTARNPAEAFQWYQRSARQNDDDGLLNLGRAYEHGIGTAADPAQARAYYQKAAALGNGPARDALANLGRAPAPPNAAQQEFKRGAALYKAGDMAGAARIFQALAEQGYPPAQLQIGWHHANGAGVARDDQLAAQWYLKSARQGYAIAQNNLAELYEQGRGLAENWGEYLRWARQSAEQGNAYGMLLVGRAYQFGIAVPQDRQQAIQWFDRAAAKGDDQAAFWAQNLKGRGNFIGFRNDDEQNYLIGGRLPTDTQLAFYEPRGQVFRSSAERNRYMRALRERTMQNEANTARAIAEDRYARCRRGETGESYCSPP
ncbi:MAG: tetratricopeptide repeat protein [Lautropia sp.]